MKDIAVYEVDELEARLVPTGLVTDLYLDPLWCVVFTHYTLQVCCKFNVILSFHYKIRI